MKYSTSIILKSIDIENVEKYLKNFFFKKKKKEKKKEFFFIKINYFDDIKFETKKKIIEICNKNEITIIWIFKKFDENKLKSKKKKETQVWKQKEIVLDTRWKNKVIDILN